MIPVDSPHGTGLETPIALFAFNRPHLTERTLAAVRAVRPQRLLLVADGARADRPEDADLTAATRRVLDAIDWPCNVSRRYATTNLGVEPSVELGLDWVFSLVPTAIVLEDDCVADPSFFAYASELLARYRDDHRVWQISGNNFGVPETLLSGTSYGFTAWGSVWGWATWADRWQAHRQVFTRDHASGSAPVRTRPASPEIAGLVTQSGRRHFAEAAVSEDVVTHGWDKHWWLTMMTLGGLAITPARNLVENVGWGADASHGVTAERRDHPAQEIEFPLIHPTDVAVHVELERELELVLSRVGGRAARLARLVVRAPAARRVLRRVAHSTAVVRFTRSWSRATSRTRS